MRKLFSIFFEYLLRKKTPVTVLLQIGSGLILGAGALATFLIKISLGEYIPYLSSVEIEYSTVYYYSIPLGVVMILFSMFLIYKDESKISRRIKLALYQSGLLNVLEENITSSLTRKTKSNIPIIKIDIHQYIENNQVKEVDKALEEIDKGICRFIDTVKDSQYDSDLYYAGLVSVPFSFYTGMELDDRYDITVFDYDRESKAWKEITNKIDFDENLMFSENKGNKDGNSIVVIACSYPINYDEIKKSFPEYPISSIKIKNININNHWDKQFHINLQRNFFQLLQALSAKGTKKVHLILAAQNSVSFNLGRIYDNRNLPEIIVYQYEKGSERKYPWGIKMKTSGISKAEIINN